ncbi:MULTISPECIES: D-2-hydroxyacid dehydrogenase [Haloarcula]|uniref:D-2-hydroxyacid dehydrogenase n=1 Tax=Haloarcula TaxID=2237 RepID=UPI0023EDA6D9|nr:D-2-hydroxyacid dehydrogenase [Halomicroarcula sp. XH51]
MTDILVMRHNIHGIPLDRYVTALRERLPDYDVAVARTPDEERELVSDATVLTGVALPDAVLDRAESLELFANIYAGYDHLPLSELAAHGIALTTASGVHGPNIAEHVIGNWLAFARGFFTARDQQQDHVWQSFPSTDFAGSTVCVVGLGAIGQAIVDRLGGFGVDTVGVRYSPEKGGPTDEVYGFDEIHDAVVDAEYVGIACPLTETTRHLFDADVFETMRPSAVVSNVARGPVVETDALVDALRHNNIGGAALDVTDPEPLPNDHPLWDFDNVLITPHNAGHTESYFQRLADIVAENVRRHEETGTWDDLQNQVDL